MMDAIQDAGGKAIGVEQGPLDHAHTPPNLASSAKTYTGKTNTVGKWRWSCLRSSASDV